MGLATHGYHDADQRFPAMGTYDPTKTPREYYSLYHAILPYVEQEAAARRAQAAGNSYVLNQFRSKTPQLYLDVDRTKVQALGVNLTDVNQTLQIELGSLDVNSFNLLDRHWQVTLQAEGEFRTRPDTLTRLPVRSAGGEMVPLSALVTLKDVSGPVSVQRYNLYPAAAVSGSVKPDVSSGDAIAAVDRLAESLPPSMRSCSCSWHSRRSTRAGRCRWR